MSKYEEVLRPFVAIMEKELHANSHKGDREGWLQMTEEQALGEIEYHVSKLSKAMTDMNPDGIREYAADVANLCMMLLDIGGQLKASPTTPQPIYDEANERELFEQIISKRGWSIEKVDGFYSEPYTNFAWSICLDLAQSGAKSGEVGHE